MYMLTLDRSHMHHVAPHVVTKSITTVLSTIPGTTLVHHLLALHHPFRCSVILRVRGGDMGVHHSHLALQHSFRVPLHLEMVIMMGSNMLVLVDWNGAAEEPGD